MLISQLYKWLGRILSPYVLINYPSARKKISMFPTMPAFLNHVASVKAFSFIFCLIFSFYRLFLHLLLSIYLLYRTVQLQNHLDNFSSQKSRTDL